MEAKRAALATGFVLVVVVAAGLRFSHLAQRPMHADEAVNADKFGTLLEHGIYRYDPTHFHGPSLPYLTLVPARARGIDRYQDLDEPTLRSVPATLGVLLAASALLLIPVLGTAAAWTAAVLTAVSPAMVFYSRDFIHEVPLAFFGALSLAALCRYLRKPGAGWAGVLGAASGLMYATKETSVIAFGALGAAVVFDILLETRRPSGSPLPEGRRWSHLVVALVAAALPTVALFAAPGRPLAVLDSFSSFRTYFGLAGAGTVHVHPWHYYLGLLLYSHPAGSPTWTEGAIVLSSVLGFAVVVSGRFAPGIDGRVARVIGLYSLALAVAYSAIPYKTPWCMLGFLHGMILLAGAGWAWLLRLCRTRAARTLAAAIGLTVAAHLGWQSWVANSRFDADARNPYVYAQTGRDVFTVVARVEGLSRAHPAGRHMPVQVITPENTWPLPWYLRRFPGVRWSTGVIDAAPSAPLILITPDVEFALVRKLYDLPPPGERELYVSAFDSPIQLRPAVELRGYAAKSLWDEYRQRSAAAPPAPPRAEAR